MKPGTLCIDSSTIDQNVSIEIASLVNAKGGHYMDAPVSGGVIGAEKGTLAFMVGGEERFFDNTLELLKLMGQNIIYCGKVNKIIKFCRSLNVLKINKWLTLDIS